MAVELETPKKKSRTPKNVSTQPKEISQPVKPSTLLRSPSNKREKSIASFETVQNQVENAEKNGDKKRIEQKTHIAIDHPQNGEKIHPHHYAIRVSSSGGDGVELSIKNGDWKSCRYSAGYYWFDWCSIEPKKYQIVARMRLPSGKYKKSNIIQCEVEK